MEARLATSILVAALVRKVEGEGGFAALIARGDPAAGALLLVLLERGNAAGFLERLVEADGRYLWRPTGPGADDNDEERQRFLERRRKFDPDLWILELDVPSAERFTAEMNAAN